VSSRFGFVRVGLLALAPVFSLGAIGQTLAASGGSSGVVLSNGTVINGKCGSSCGKLMLSILNHTRSQYRLSPLQLKRAQTNGKQGCAGSLGHSTAMAQTGAIWHTNTRYPKASFPNNICVRYTSAGENVGESSNGNLAQALQAMQGMMMSEPHSRSLCSSTVNHACNILSAGFRYVGIGIYVAKGTTWLTEDFVS
jgi:uncharacterized protein YkwD